MTPRGRRRGQLWALEGIDGAGKSTLAQALGVSLRRRGIRVVLRREPADPELGHLAQVAAARDPWTGAVYFTLDRWRARPGLMEDLRRADVVVTDRSFYSTLAYQGSALSRAAVTTLDDLSRRATVRPDRVVWLDLPPAEAIRRLGARARVRGPLERRRTLVRVAGSYRRLARAGGWLRLDARRPTDELAAATLRAFPVKPRSGGGRRPSRT